MERCAAGRTSGITSRTGPCFPAAAVGALAVASSSLGFGFAGAEVEAVGGASIFVLSVLSVAGAVLSDGCAGGSAFGVVSGCPVVVWDGEDCEFCELDVDSG